MSVDLCLQYLMRLILAIFSRLPLGLLRKIGAAVGWLNFALNTQVAKITRVNLELCLPDLSEPERLKLCKDSLIHTGQTALETPAVWLSPLMRSRAWISEVQNEALLDEAIKAGRGVIVLLPHLGNWEMFNVYFATRGKMTALYQPPKQAFMKPIMEAVRENLGNELVPTNVKGIARLYRCLQQGEVAVILPDQVPASGRFAPFFGEPALTDVLVSRLVKKTSACVICCTVSRDQNGFVVSFSEVDDRLYASDIDTSLSGLNRSVENAVSENLAQYQWEYKRYRERPAGLEKLYKFRQGPKYFH